MDKIKQQQHLWSLLDNLRGEVQPQEVVEALSLLGLIAKFNSEGFTQLYNSGGNHQIELLESLLRECQQQHPALPCDISPLRHWSPTTWQLLIYYLHDYGDMLESLPPLLRHASQEWDRNYAEAGTTESLQQLFIELADNAVGKILYDGTAGLASIAAAMNSQQLWLEELNQQTWAISYRLLVIEGLEPIFTPSDSLLESAHTEKADLAIMEPPFGYRILPRHAEQLLQSGTVIVDPGKKLPASAGDVLWIQQALQHVNDQGKVLMLLPQGWLFRGGYDAKVRDYLLDEDLIEAVIGLPAGLLRFTGIPTMILILNKGKPAGQPMHFIDAASMGHKLKRGSALSTDEITLIGQLARGEHPEHKNYQPVYIPDIRKKGKKGIGGNNLNIGDYFDRTEEFELPDIATELAQLRSVQQHFEQAQMKLNALLMNTEGKN